MARKSILKGLALLLVAAGLANASEDPKDSNDPNAAPKPTPAQLANDSCREIQTEESDPVVLILRRLNERTRKLKSYEANVEYKFIQPLLDSQALRKGLLYFAKFGPKSRLRINFDTLRQDDEKEQKYIEQFIFDGTWLTRLDYQMKAVKRYQLAEPNQPTDAFELASRNLPIIGFSRVEDLQKQFDIKLVEQPEEKSPDAIHLHLTVKPDSVHKEQYTTVDFWIDKKLWLPARVVAVSTEEDIYEFRLLKPKLDRPLDKKIFDFVIPAGFGEPEIVPLKKKNK